MRTPSSSSACSSRASITLTGSPFAFGMIMSAPGLTCSSTASGDTGFNAIAIAFSYPVSAVAFAEPVDNSLAHDSLGPARHEHADVPARQTELGVVVGPELAVEGTRGRRRNDVIGLRIDVEHRHRDLPQVDGAPTELPRVVDELVVLVE